MEPGKLAFTAVYLKSRHGYVRVGRGAARVVGGPAELEHFMRCYREPT